MESISISIILPVYNNETTLLELHSQLVSVLEKKKLFFEIIFVNDASFDRSISILNQIAAEDSRVKIISFETNKGQNQAVLEGLRHSQGSIMVVMDADLQDSPQIIPKILHKLNQGYDAVFVGRLGKYESFMRILTSKFFKFCLAYLLKLPRDAGLFFTITKKTALNLQKIPMPRPYIVAMIGLIQSKTCSIPFIRYKQKQNKTGYTFFKRLKIALSALFFIIRHKSKLHHMSK